MSKEEFLKRIVFSLIFLIALSSNVNSMIQIEATIDPNNLINESDESNTILVENQVVETRGLRILFLPIDFDMENDEEKKSYEKAVEEQKEYLKAVYPLAEDGLEVSAFSNSIYTAERTTLIETILLVKVAKELAGFFDFGIGIVPENWFYEKFGTSSGGAKFPIIPNAVLADISSKEIVAHEIGHEFGLCDEYNGYCGNVVCFYEGIPILGGLGCTFCPNKYGQSCEIEGSCVAGQQAATCIGESNLKGFWVNKRKEIGQNINYFSFMGQGGSYRWASQDVYNHLLSKLSVSPLSFSSTSFSSLDKVAYFSSSNQQILVSGLVDKNGWVGLQGFYVIDNSPEQDIPTGDYSLKLLDSQNNILLDQSFGVSFLLLSDPPIDLNTSGFVFTVPFIEGTKTIEVIYNGEIKAERVVSDNPPTVSIISPNGNEKWNGVRTIEWNAGDADGDSLSFVLQYSDDNGSIWNPIAINLSETNYDLNFDILKPANTYKIKVIATDGILTEEATSNTFTIQPQDSTDIDSDGDGVNDEFDKCPNTIRVLEVYGCSCEQILELKPGKDEGELKNGCSPGTIKVFKKQIGWAKNIFE